MVIFNNLNRYNSSLNSISIEDFRLKKRNVMLGDTPSTQFMWVDPHGDIVAEFKIWNWRDGINVSDLEVNPKYRGLGLSYQLLDYATTKCGAINLAVNKNNDVAKHVYDKYGFKIVDEDQDMYYMTLEERT